MKKRTTADPAARLGWIFLIVGLLVFAIITSTVRGIEGASPFDQWAIGFFQDWFDATPPWMAASIWGISFVSFYLSILLGLLLPVYWYRRRSFRPFWLLLMSAWGGSALWLALLFYFDRERPAQIVFGMPGYPSGHAMSMFTYYAVLLYIFFLPLIRRRLFRRIMALWLIWALLNGYSRLFLDVHYPTDVAAGYAIGTAWLGLAMLVLPLPVRPPPLDDPVRPEDMDVDV
jgi:membrane-associated phospholipid phosphatase